MKFATTIFAISFFSATLFLSGCSSDSAEDNETAQQVGDAMASVDEMGGSSGSLALINFGATSAFAQLNEDRLLRAFETLNLIPSVDAATCAAASTFGSCSSGSLTRTFGGCTVGSATFAGTVGFEFSDSACSMSSIASTVKRNPNFTVTGKAGGTLSVTKTGTNGQMLTRSSSTVFSFSNDGIRRVITNSAGTIVYDFTTTTTSSVNLTGTARASRTLSGGSFRITNNLTPVTCDLEPSSVTWTSTCNCATSGTWAGSCSDGKTMGIEITGCGTADFTLNSATTAVSFDRCYGI